MSVAVAVPVLALFTVILCVPPFAWHFKHRNLAASSLVFWIVLSNLFNFVNSLIWKDDNLDSWWHGYVLCDIEVKLMNAANVGIPASLVAVMRSLALVLDTERTVLQPSSAQRRRKLAIDALLCFGVPVYMIIIHYVVQNIRYYIFAVAGCVPSSDNSWPSIALIHIWSPIFSLIDGYYSLLVVYRIRKYRKEFAAILQCSNSGLNKSRFLRLFFMCLVLTILGVPVQLYILYKNCTYPMIPYSWSRIHGPAWGDIILIPTNGSVTFDHWVQLAVGLTIFIFFGLGHDAMKMYRQCLVKLGFGKLFPSLLAPTHRPSDDRRPSILSETGSFSSRAYSFVKTKLFRSRVTSSSSGSSHDRTSYNETSITSSSSPETKQRPFSPLLATVSDDPSGSTPSNEKAAAGTHPAMPEPAHADPSRLARFLANTKVSGPYNGIHATSLFAGMKRRS